MGISLVLLADREVRLALGLREGRPKVMVVSTWTDYPGSGAVLNKLMTTKFSTSAVLMDGGLHEADER